MRVWVQGKTTLPWNNASLENATNGQAGCLRLHSIIISNPDTSVEIMPIDHQPRSHLPGRIAGSMSCQCRTERKLTR